MKFFNVSYEKEQKCLIINFLGFKFKLKNNVSELCAKEENLEYFIKNFVDVNKLKPAQGKLREAQLDLLDFLKYFDDICKKNNLPYWLDSGTLLGAIRNQGFIPWDDDVDVCMLRKDYNKLYKILKEELKDSEVWFLRERAKTRVNYLQIRVICKKYNLNLGFDVFPLDNYFKKDLDENEKKEVTQNIFKAKKALDDKYCKREYSDLEVAEIKKDIINIQNEIVLKSNKALDGECALFFGIDFLSDAKILIIDYDTVFPLKEVEFEGGKYFAPNKCDVYLKNFYDDFMALPQNFSNETGLKSEA